MNNAIEKNLFVKTTVFVYNKDWLYFGKNDNIKVQKTVLLYKITVDTFCINMYNIMYISI